MAAQKDISTTYEVKGHNTYSTEDLLAKDFRVLSRDGDKMRILMKNKTYDVTLTDLDTEKKEVKIKVSGIGFNVTISEPLDTLIKELGFLKTLKHSVKEIKSPMPGLVINIFVQAGSQVNEGVKLISLEAMKMENIIKSPGEGIIKLIHINKGNSVEKNQLLIEFE